MKRVIKDTLLSAGAIAVLLLILVSLDHRVRDHVFGLAQSSTVSSAGSTIATVASVLMVAARDQSVEHAPFVIFVVAGLVLFVFMFRT